MNIRCLFLATSLLASTLPWTCHAGEHLEKVLIIKRHGVRAAMSSPQRLGEFSLRPWPHFSVPPGHLTVHGSELESISGAYLHALYLQAGLLHGDVGDCHRVHYRANQTQRTLASAEAIAKTLSPGCEIAISSVGEGQRDPLFEGAPAAHAPNVIARMANALAGRVGGHAVAWNAAQADAIDTLQALLLQCDARPCPASATRDRRRLDAIPARLPPPTGGIPGIEGPAATASGITESLLMGWADGQDFAALGWHGLDEAMLLRVFAPHQAEIALRLRTPDIARIASSQLASQVLATLLQGSDLHTRHTPIGNDAVIVVLAGHDGTQTLLAGMLDLHWQLEGYQPDQTPPGGALIFERWRQDDERRVVRVRYLAQSLNQLRQRKPLSLQSPPLSSAIAVPGCVPSGNGLDCPLPRFQQILDAAIDPAFVLDGATGLK